ncbi:hypothetical protein Emag_005952 [Eimeria magna]
MSCTDGLEVLGVHVVGVWRWKGVPADLHCVICDNAFELPCAQCDSPGDACPPAFGACGHVFHLHCIGAWLYRDGARYEEQGTCPMCRQLWTYAPQQPRALELGNVVNSQSSEQHSQADLEEGEDEQIAVYAQHSMELDSHPEGDASPP